MNDENTKEVFNNFGLNINREQSEILTMLYKHYTVKEISEKKGISYVYIYSLVKSAYSDLCRLNGTVNKTSHYRAIARLLMKYIREFNSQKN